MYRTARFDLANVLVMFLGETFGGEADADNSRSALADTIDERAFEMDVGSRHLTDHQGG